MAERQWSNHKYIRKEGNRYIYPEDLQKTPKQRKLIDNVGGTQIRAPHTSKQIIGNRVHNQRRSALNLQASPNYKQISQNHADQMKEVRELDKMYREETNNRAAGNRASMQENAKKQGEFSKQMMKKEKIAETVQRKRDGSYDRMHGQVTQEAAKKQGQFSKDMMRKEKAAEAKKRGGKLVRSITDADGNRHTIRGRAATNTIANKSDHYDKASGERISSQEYQAKRKRSRQKGSDWVSRRLSR